MRSRTSRSATAIKNEHQNAGKAALLAKVKKENRLINGLPGAIRDIGAGISADIDQADRVAGVIGGNEPVISSGNLAIRTCIHEGEYAIRIA